MRAGLLRHRITLQAPMHQPGEWGGADATEWQDVATVWAAVEPIAGREFFAAAQAQSEVTHRVRIRCRSGVRADMRVSFGGRVLTIDAVLSLDGGEMHLMCKEMN